MQEEEGLAESTTRASHRKGIAAMSTPSNLGLEPFRREGEQTNLKSIAWCLRLE